MESFGIQKPEHEATSGLRASDFNGKSHGVLNQWHFGVKPLHESQLSYTNASVKVLGRPRCGRLKVDWNIESRMRTNLAAAGHGGDSYVVT
jgi:hypothetical protein